MYQCEFKLEECASKSYPIPGSDSNSANLSQMMMSLIATNEQQSATIDYLMRKISQLEQNEKSLK